MRDLTNIADQIKLSCETLPLNSQGKIRNILSNCITFTEASTLLAEQADENSKNLLSNIVDEFFVDIHISCLLAIGQQYKSASVIARTAIELAIYYIYFIDHRVELGTWANASQDNHKYDMSFRDTVKLICNEEYMTIASNGSEGSKEAHLLGKTLVNVYRNFSERVHGKYKFLFTSEKNDPKSFDLFCQSTLEVTSALAKLIAIRLGDNPSIQTSVPALENIYG